MIRAFRDECVEVVDHGQNASAEWDLVAFETGGIALAVVALVMTQDERSHRIRERHAADDLGAHLGMNPDLLELFMRERSRLREDVLGNRQLADVVQQRRRLDALDLVLAHPQRTGETGGVHLHAAHVALRRLVLGVDGERQRLDGGEMEIGHLQHVPLLIVDAAHVHRVGAVDEIRRRRGEEHHPVAAAVDDAGGGHAGAGANEMSWRAPQKVLTPDARDRP